MKVYVVTDESLSNDYIVDVFKDKKDAEICIETMKNDIIRALDNEEYGWDCRFDEYKVKFNDEIPDYFNCNKGVFIYQENGSLYKNYELIKLEEFELK